MPTGAGIVERNRQGEYGEPVEPRAPTPDSDVDNKNLEQNNNNNKTSSTSEVPQKMKSLEKQPTKSSTPEAVKESAHTRSPRHMWRKEKEKAGASPQVRKILTTFQALIYPVVPCQFRT